MKRNIIRWSAVGLIVLTIGSYFLPWLSLKLSQETLLAVTTELDTAGLTHAARALQDGHLTPVETMGVTMELAALLDSDAWKQSATGMLLSGTELAQLRLVLLAFLTVLCLSLLLLLCDLLLCASGRLLCEKRRILPLLCAIVAPLFVALLLLLYAAMARMFPIRLLSMQWGMVAAAAMALGSAVLGCWTAMEKRR